MRFMVDTLVLINATRKITGKTEPHDEAIIRACKRLISPLTRIPVSAIVASEYVPITKDNDLWSRLEIIPFDGEQGLPGDGATPCAGAVSTCVQTSGERERAGAGIQNQPLPRSAAYYCLGQDGHASSMGYA